MGEVMEIMGLLLCGGEARRYGANKLLEGDEPLAARAARNLMQATGQVLAVIPAGAGALRAALEPVGCEVLESDRTTRGMGASIAAGVEASAQATGWIVALGDMPLVRPDTIRRVRRALEEGARLVAPFSDGRRGHPVGFSWRMREELLALDGDTGARVVIARNGELLERLAIDDPGIFVDVDTREDFARLASLAGNDLPGAGIDETRASLM
jgi:molybdenum cofactor cytidylyltransferase